MQTREKSAAEELRLLLKNLPMLPRPCHVALNDTTSQTFDDYATLIHSASDQPILAINFETLTPAHAARELENLVRKLGLPEKAKQESRLEEPGELGWRMRTACQDLAEIDRELAARGTLRVVHIHAFDMLDSAESGEHCEGCLRSVTQFFQAITLIFTSCESRSLRDMAFDSKRPFYGSLKWMPSADNLSFEGHDTTRSAFSSTT